MSDMVFSGHWELAENHGVEIPEINREEAALPHLRQLAECFPRLKIVAEHASTNAMVNYVRCAPQNIWATLTCHHMALVWRDVCDPDGTIYAPHRYCKPIAKTEADVRAVRGAAVSGDRKFFFGSDSAPHPKSAKQKYPPAAGIFTPAEVALPFLFQFFWNACEVDMFDAFRVKTAEKLYGFKPCEQTLILKREEWIVPAEYNGIVPFLERQIINWRLSE